MNLYYRLVFNDGSQLDVTGDAAQMVAAVAQLSPGDLAGYQKFMKLSYEMCRVGFEELGHVPSLSLLDMVRVAPDLACSAGAASTPSSAAMSAIRGCA